MYLSAKWIFENYYRKTHKKFGQNFLFDENINSRIVSTAGDLQNKIVVEIGPGPGGLTLEILKRNPKKLYVIEYDNHWASVWRELRPMFGDKLEVIECDALMVAPQAFTHLDSVSALQAHYPYGSEGSEAENACGATTHAVRAGLTSTCTESASTLQAYHAYGSEGSEAEKGSNVTLVSNLPYNISTQLLFKWLPQFDLCETYVLMFQKEVADRLCAVPSTKSYGRISVLAQWRSTVRKVFDLEPGSFSPPPKVKSSVLQFVPFSRDECDHYEDFECFSQILTDVFMHRRKIMLGPMKKYFQNPVEVLQSLGYDSNTRAEQISVQDFIKILQLHQGQSLQG
ncbi:hypothetical protein FACS1894122_08580 [Alphaproteobacteria bacterium]|nr:hypothetical protein FACS1894122_08580 [Alphaproteobacteria bacterium]